MTNPISFLDRQTVQHIKSKYPSGTRVELVCMNDPYNTSLQPGCLGTVFCVDDCGTIHVNWDNGSSLGVIPYVDAVKIINN